VDIVEEVPALAPVAVVVPNPPDPVAATARVRLEDLFKEPQLPERKRALPRKAKIGLVVGGAVLLMALAAGRRSKGAPPQVSTEAGIPEGSELVVAESDLKRRREVSPADFQPRNLGTSRGPAPRPSPESPAAGSTGGSQYGGEDDTDELEERRLRREGRRSTGERRRVSTPAGPDENKPAGELGMWDRQLSLAPEDPMAKKAGVTDASGKAGKAARLAPAGATIPATLTTPLVVGGAGSATAVAEVRSEGVLPVGTRFLGTATLDGDRVEIRFRGAVLPDGHEIRLRGEAQDSGGEFGLAVSLPQPKGPEREVAEDTAVDMGLGALGVGVLGNAARAYTDKRSTARWERASAKVGAGTEIIVFLQEAAVMRDDD
jgi:hypothetical protein